MFTDGDMEDEVSKVAEAASKDPAMTTQLTVTENSRQTKLVRFTRHVTMLDHRAELFHRTSRLSLLYHVAVGANNYHSRVGSSSLHTDTHIQTEIHTMTYRHRSSRLSLLYHVAVCADNYHSRVGSPGLHTDTYRRKYVCVSTAVLTAYTVIEVLW